MTTLSTRPVRADDLPTLAEYWYDRMALRQQAVGGVDLDADAASAWQAEAALWLQDARVMGLVIALGDEVLGGAWARMQGDSALLLAWVLDLHLRPGLSGAGQRLLADVGLLLHQQGVRGLLLPNPQGLAVEEAFWRAVGAQPQAEYWVLPLVGGGRC